jgi:hypothetical protein
METLSTSCRIRIYKKDKETLHKLGYEISAFGRHAIHKELEARHNKIIINRSCYPLQNQNQQANPANSPDRAVSDAMFALKVPTETIKQALKKDSY